MSSFTIYHNPRCSKSRQTLALLNERGIEPDIVEYLKSPLSMDDLQSLQQKLGVPVGIIQRAYAGTPIEGWMPWDIQRNDPRAQAHKKGLDDSANRMIGRGETRQKALEGFQKNW